VEAIQSAPEAQLRYKSVAFGHFWSSDIPLHGFMDAPADAVPDIEMRRVGALAERGPPIAWSADGSLYADGLRLALRDVTLDLFGGNRIDILPRAGYSGELPPETFGVATGTSLAMRGLLPLHGSAVEIDGRAVLLCGPAGAGKSTLAAGLTLHGGKLISDDLSVVSASVGQRPELYLGRPSIRLFPAVAEWLDPDAAHRPHPVDRKGKVLLRPARVDALHSVPLDTIVLLRPRHPNLPSARRRRTLAETLLMQLYRPNWLRYLPGAQNRLALIDILATSTQLIDFPVTAIRDRSMLDALCRNIIDRIAQTHKNH